MARRKNNTQVGHNQSFSGVGASPKAGKARRGRTRKAHSGRI